MDPTRRCAARIRDIRERRRLTQAELAELIDRSLNVVSRLERGLSKPTFDNLCRLAKALRVPIGDFFAVSGGDGDDGGDGGDGSAALRRDLLEAARALPPGDLELAARIVGLMAGRHRGGAA